MDLLEIKRDRQTDNRSIIYKKCMEVVMLPKSLIQTIFIYLRNLIN
jgi:hypothetical protein